jgi:HK97 family phage prohead protease
MSETEVENVQGGEFAYRAIEPDAMHLREEGDGAPVLEGRMMPYGEWTEINSSVEGHFMERFAPGSLAKTMNEQASRIRVLLEHGLDRLGRQAIAAIEGFRDEQDGAYYRAALLDGLPPLLVSGLRRGLYGSSVRFKPVKWDRVRSPGASEHNPEGIEERTVREGFVKELSVVTFPAYSGATAMVRSLTDEIAAKQLLGDPERLLDYLRATPPAEPPHSEREEPDVEDVEAPAPSRSTRPVHDYLRPEEDDQSWRL